MMGKRAKIKLEFNVSDEFVPGKCRECPFVIKRDREEARDVWVTDFRCPFYANAALCPVEIIKE